jgi:anti-sigma regulatory factor (Ser/Thr protein kinase)
MFRPADPGHVEKLTTDDRTGRVRPTTRSMPAARTGSLSRPAASPVVTLRGGTMHQSRFTGSIAHCATDRQKHGRRPEHPPAGQADEADQADQADQPDRTDGLDRADVSSLSWSFPGTPADVSCSRRWLAVAVTELWGEGEDTDRLVLAYSEIATNAVVHGTGPVSVAAHIYPTGARCEIADRSSRLPKARHASSVETGGRGLEMVQLTVDRLRVAADEAGKTVSFVVGRHDREPEGGKISDRARRH